MKAPSAAFIEFWNSLNLLIALVTVAVTVVIVLIVAKADTKPTIIALFSVNILNSELKPLTNGGTTVFKTSNPPVTNSPIPEIIPVILSLPMASIISLIFVTIPACIFPTAPSIVLVEVAASLATSVIPKSRIALLNSSALIFPCSNAFLKSPV